MKQRVRQINNILWLAKADKDDIAEMDSKFQRVKGRLQWIDDTVPVAQSEPTVEAPVEELAEVEVITLTAEALLGGEE